MIFILLPAYNEAPNIRPVLDQIAAQAPQWDEPLGIDGVRPGTLPVTAVVIDDGSADDTAQLARTYDGPIQVTVISHDENQGLAAALKSGIDYITRHAHDYDEVITMDADGTHSPEYMASMLDLIRGGHDIVVASRFAPGGKEHGVSRLRRFLSRGARHCYHYAFPHIPLRDFSCGYRAFRAKVLKGVSQTWGETLFQTVGFACTGELMLKALAFTTPERVKEIPFELHYERKQGASKMPAWRTIISTLWMLRQARRWQKNETQTQTLPKQ